MKLQKVLTGTSVVSLIFVPSIYSGTLRLPKFGEYENPCISRIVPCEVIGDKYFDLRTGELVETDENTQVWMAHTGTVFSYPDGVELLISRNYHTRELLCFRLENRADFHVGTMVRHEVREKSPLSDSNHPTRI